MAGPEGNPWWAANRDTFLLYLAASMFAVLLLGLPRALAALREEHSQLLTVMQIMCVHDAAADRERRECLTLQLDTTDSP